MLISMGGALFGSTFFFFIGKTMNVVVDGHLLHVEMATGALGLIAGYTIASLFAPKPIANESHEAK